MISIRKHRTRKLRRGQVYEKVQPNWDRMIAALAAIKPGEAKGMASNRTDAALALLQGGA